MFSTFDPYERRDGVRRYYDDVLKAEAAARRKVKAGGAEYVLIDRVERREKGEVKTIANIATVCKDALDRVWTDVDAGPGQVAFL